MFITYRIGKKQNSNEHEIITVKKNHILTHLSEYIHSTIVNGIGFDWPARRLSRFGLNALAYQSPFTIACAFSHRRAWQHFQYSNYSRALILEEDAVQAHNISIDNLIRSVTFEWDFLQLGRCWDFCSTEQTIHRFKYHRFVTSENPCCSHAYMITHNAAEQLLRYSLPHVVSIDLLFTFLNRKKIINVKSITPVLFIQNRSKKSHDTTKLLECDPSETEKRKTGFLDTNLFSNIQNHWMQSYIWKSTIDYTSTTYCRLEKYCRTYDRNRYNISNRSMLNDYPFKNAEFLVKSVDAIFAKLKLNGVVIWNRFVTPNCNIHVTLLESFRFIFSHSTKKKHLCFMENITHRCTSPFLRNSLVFVSSQQAIFHNPNLHGLFYHPSNIYIFHGTPPTIFQRATNVFQWKVPRDYSIVDSIDYQNKRLIKMNYGADILPYDLVKKSNNKMIPVLENVDRSTFCKFVRTFHNVVKMNFNKFDCGKYYKYVPYNRTLKHELIKNARFIPFLIKNTFIHPDVYTSILYNKPILTTNRHIYDKFQHRIVFRPNIELFDPHETYTVPNLTIKETHNTFVHRILTLISQIQMYY